MLRVLSVGNCPFGASRFLCRLKAAVSTEAT
jgi:hypothetical protein